MEPQHLIQKYIFDVEYDSEEKAYQFQTQVAACVKEKLVKITDDIFTEIGSGKSIGIKKLVIDLGEINPDNFEIEVYSKLKEQLSDKLKLLMAGVGIVSQEETPEYISPEKSDLVALQFFLEQGTLPWSSRKSEPISFVKALLVQLLNDNPDAVKKLIGSLISKEEIKLRIIRQVEDEVIFNMLKLWAESETGKFYKLYSDLVKIYSYQPVIKNSFVEYRELIWKFILLEVLVRKEYKKNIAELASVFFEFVAKEVSVTKENTTQLFFKALFVQSGDERKITSDFELIRLFGDAKKIDALADKLNLETSLYKAVVELVRQEGAKSKGDRENSLEAERLKKVEQEEFEQFKRIAIEKRKNSLIQFFSIVKYIADVESIRPQLARVELIIKEFSITNPAFLKKVLAEAKIESKEFSSQFVLELFSEEVQIVLRDILQLDKNEFVRFKEEASLKIVSDFFDTGIFPYTSIPPSFKSSDIERVFWKVFKAEEKRVGMLIKGSIAESTDREFKINQVQSHFSSDFIKEYFEEFPEIAQPVKSKEKREEEVSKESPVLLSEVKTIDHGLLILRDFIQNKSFPKEVTFTVSEIIEKVISLNKQASVAFLVSLKSDDLQVIQKAVLAPLVHELTKMLDEFKESVKQVLTTIKSEEEKDLIVKVKDKEGNGKKDSDAQQFEYKKLSSGEPIYIGNAGLVVVHPYLSRFFGLLNLLDKRAFKDEISAHKAAHILQYLVNKSVNSEEHELVLNKLICGIDLHTPLMRDIEITEEDKVVCENLLEGVIQNWTILKKTSNDNFRASFLMREGRLVPEAMNWRLRVEERGYDILVEKIPWSIAMIKLPWMKSLINVEWK